MKALLATQPSAAHSSRVAEERRLKELSAIQADIASAVLASPRNTSAGNAQDAWRQYRSLGERLAATSVPGAPSVTEAVSQMRR